MRDVRQALHAIADSGRQADARAAAMTGRTVLVTGGGSGIGRATAERFAKLGANVVIGDISPATREVAEAIGVRSVRLDVTSRDSYDGALAQVAAWYEGLDVLYLNAGVQSTRPGVDIGTAGFPWLTDEVFKRVTSVNLWGVVAGTIAAREAGPARPSDIVVTASIAGLQPLPIDPLYSMTKHGVIGLVRSVAPLLAKEGVRLQAICPGGVDTNIVPPDLRKEGTHLAPPSYIADGVLHALEHGKAGDVWLATDANMDYRLWEFSSVKRGQPPSEVWNT